MNFDQTMALESPWILINEIGIITCITKCKTCDRASDWGNLEQFNCQDPIYTRNHYKMKIRCKLFENKSNPYCDCSSNRNLIYAALYVNNVTELPGKTRKTYQVKIWKDLQWNLETDKSIELISTEDFLNHECVTLPEFADTLMVDPIMRATILPYKNTLHDLCSRVYEKSYQKFIKNFEYILLKILETPGKEVDKNEANFEHKKGKKRYCTYVI